MAAVEDEGSQSENKNDDANDKCERKPFSAMFQEVESKLTRTGISYEERVDVILSGWDRLAGTASSGQLPFATFIYKWTLQLVLQGEWPRLNKIVKTRLKATLQRCNQDERLKQMCDSLLPLVTDPWGHPTLKAIIADSPVTDEEVEQYILEETWPVVRVRINTLVESRCEKLAFSVLKECMRYIRLKTNTSERPLLNSQEDHNHFVDLYFILLYKYDKPKFVEEIKDMDFMEGIDHVRRLLAQQEKGKIWKNRLKVAELEMHIFITTLIVKPFDKVFSYVFIQFCNVIKDLETVELEKMMRKFLELSESSQYVYTMGSILHEQFGETHAALVTELLIRALTRDMNDLEAVKLQAKDGPKEEQTRLEHQMAEGFMNLATVFAHHESVARECVLTAFSLHPTQNYLEKLEIFGVSQNTLPKELKIEENFENNSEVSSQIKEKSEFISQTSAENSNGNGPQFLIERERSEEVELSNRVIDELPCQSYSNSGNTVYNQDQFPPHIEDKKSLTSVMYDSDIHKGNCIDVIDVNKVPLNKTTEVHFKENCETQSQNSSPNVINDDIRTELPLLPEIREFPCSNSDPEKDSSLQNNLDVWELVNESGKKVDLSVNKADETKVKEDIDSMDGFLATTEDLIEQLNQGKETKLNNDSEHLKERDKPPPEYDVLTDSQVVLNREKLGISKELCDDLAVVLSSPRWQVLSWKHGKSQLLSICEKYMKDVDSAKNVTKELKFLNIDYNQFKHLPSVEVDEYTGIEKGYEHFMEQDSDLDDQEFYYGIHQNYSSSSDFESNKRNRGSMFTKRGRRGRPPLKHKYFNSDSDSTGRSRSVARTTTSLSESEDSEFDINSVTDKDKEYEGKRVTAVSSFDRRKRLRIDATTGRVKSSHNNRTSNVSILRRYRHQNSVSFSNSTESHLNHSVKKVVNGKPNVILNHYDRSSINNKFQISGEHRISTNNYVSCVKSESNDDSSNPPKPGERKPASASYFHRSNNFGSWRYAGYVVSRPHKDNVSLVTPTTTAQPDALKCSYRTREGKVFHMNPHSGFEEKKHEVEFKKMGNSTKYQETFAKFLLQNKFSLHDKLVPNITIRKGTVPLEESLQYLKRQGTSVIRKKGDNTTVLATAQKNVLNQIMSPENSRHDIVGRSDQHLPVRAIAMPVSHNPPNLPPDKSNPTGLSRPLPKGTTVVRRSKIDSGAGPSGLNNGGSNSLLTRSPLVRSISNQPRPTISITPSSNFLGSSTSVVPFTNTVPIRNNLNQQSHESPSTSSLSGPSQQENERFSPLASATVVGSVSQTLSPRLNSNNSPGETQGSCFVSLNSNLVTYSSSMNQATSNTTTTTVAAISGETRTPSMLETLLRDRSTPSSPLIQPLTSESSVLATASSNSESVVTSAPGCSLTEAVSLVSTHSVSSGTSLPLSSSNITNNTSSDGQTSSMASNINLGVSTIPVVGSTVLTSSLPVISSGVGTHVAVSTGGTSASVEPQPSGMHQLLLPAHFIQVQGSDGSTNLGIVHPSSFDLRFPPGTRVIKSPASNMRPTTPVAISQSATRPLNVLHNVKIVQNRQIVRTVVVPHSVALQGLGPQQTAQLVALGQSPGTSNSLESQNGAKISSQLQKMLGHNVVPGGLVIRTIRPPSSEMGNDDLPKPSSSIIQHTSEINQSPEKNKETEKIKGNVLHTQEEGLAERLSKNFLKNAFLASTSTQSVGTQTQTTAVKPVTGQLVNQVVMNHLRGIGGTSSVSTVPVSTTPVVANAVTTPLSSLSLSSSNAVSSETLEQLREFESVFEKVSNKSVKENDNNGPSNHQNIHPPSVSSEESMIAAQLLSMSNDTPNTSGSSYIYTVPTTSTESSVVALSSPSATTNISSTAVSGTRLGEGTYITIPTSSQGGTLILVNPSVATPGTMTITSNAQATQPPPAASPALSSTSSHSSVASSPSSTSSKSKSKGSKSKGLTPSSTPLTPTKPKSPPPPKAPPKPAVAKPQVEESDETKARIQAILDQYKQDLANTPQPQPAPRNRKNCPPPKNEGKSSSKKKSQVKKPDGTTSTSPNTSDSGHLPSVSPSPLPLPVTPSGEDSDGSIGGVSVASSHFHSQEEKKSEESSQSPQILQGVVVSNMKVDNNALGNNLSIPQGRVVQLIRHGSKVTAITRQTYPKSKSGLASGGPPPNVTIQGRINMNELMESHLASLLTQGSATITPGSAIITKLIQAQQQHTPSVQQLVVQTSGGIGQQIQQVSLQPVIATTSKSQIQNQLITGGVNVVDSSNPSPNSPVKPILQPQPSPAMSVGVSHSPDTPQQRVSSPSTPSPAPELPSTPSSFPTAEESNSSEESVEDTSAAPLPPFFTLTKQYMSPQPNQQLNSSNSQVSLPSESTARSPLKLGSETSSNSSPSRSLNSQTSRSNPFIRSTYTKSMNLSSTTQSSIVSKASISGTVMLAHSAPPSPLINQGENVLDMSPVSGPSSLENSPLLSQRLPLVTTSELKSNSLDSVKSDLSVEEVQIPPSPATLTKQLQNAYMTESALSPNVSHSHLSSSSSYSSPTTMHDLQTGSEPRVIFPNLAHTSHTYSLAGQSSSTSSLSNNSNCSSSHNNPSMENNTLACLSSPSGDVYLDQAGVSLGLDSLPLVEGRSQSPSLSDLVPAVPLLSWSPRSADSIMGQSPSLNEALSGNMTLDVHNSEDSLCDSSTGFPGLFAMDGDAASTSSSNSDDVLNSSNNSCPISTFATTTTVFSVAPSHSHSQTKNPVSLHTLGKRLTNHEQDHTVSSTKTENLGISSLRSNLEISQCDQSPDSVKKNSVVNELDTRKQKSDISKVKLGSDEDEEDEDDGNDNSFSRNKNESLTSTHKTHTKKGFINAYETHKENCKSKEVSDYGVNKKVKNQVQSKEVIEKNISASASEIVKEEVVHNGYEKLNNCKHAASDETKMEDFVCNSKSESTGDTLHHQLFGHKYNSFKLEKSYKGESFTEEVEKNEVEAKKETKLDVSGRQTRGSKRRSDSDFIAEEKRSRSSRSRRSEVTLADLSPEEEKPQSFLAEDGAIVGPLTRSFRGRHVSGTSDSSSNYSIDRVSTPGPQDSPAETGNISGASRRRKRRGSHDSSVSSRDGSPLTVLLNSQQDVTVSTGGMHTRRSSSRDHAKKTRCRCCVDQSSPTATVGGSRRTSGRMSRGSGANASSSAS